MGLATFLFYVSLSYGGYSEIHVVPMPSSEVCEKVVEHMNKDIANSNSFNPFSFDDSNVMTAFKPHCKTY
jgi:hypothetical protein